MKFKHSGLAIVFLVLLSTSIPVPTIKAKTTPSYQQLHNAATYIAKRYDARIGLVSESEDTSSDVPDGTPCYRTFWIYDDNLWASQALKPFYPQIANNISRTITPYIAKYGNSQLFEVVLGIEIPTTVHARNKLKVATYTLKGDNYTVWVDRHRAEDGEIFYDADEYADLAFYLSLDYYLTGNIKASERWFRIGEAMWRDHGFYDKYAKAYESYQSFKLGLYLLTAKATGFISAIYDSVEKVAWSYQKGNGGIAAESHLNGTIYGTANIEATAALLLAYNDELIERFRPIKPPDEQVIIIVLGVVITAIVTTVFIALSDATPSHQYLTPKKHSMNIPSLSKIMFRLILSLSFYRYP